MEINNFLMYNAYNSHTYFILILLINFYYSISLLFITDCTEKTDFGNKKLNIVASYPRPDLTFREDNDYKEVAAADRDLEIFFGKYLFWKHF